MTDLYVYRIELELVYTVAATDKIDGGSIEVPTRVPVRGAAFDAQPAIRGEVPVRVSLREGEVPMKATVTGEVPTRVKVRGEGITE